MRYWWVNQNQTYRQEVDGGFLWSPKTRADGAKNYFYQTMEEIRQGDLVFSFCDTFIKAIGIVQRSATTTVKPLAFGEVGANWQNVGWYVEVEYAAIQNPIRPKDFMTQISPLLNIKYAPLQRNGNGLQGVYLTEISKVLADLLVMLSRSDLPNIQRELAAAPDPDSEYEIELEIQSRHFAGDLEKVELTKSRRGQGIFRANVRQIEHRCRVTGISTFRHLRASHIKPWAKSDDREKIDGANGLLLSPHVDHLFDRGFISFGDEGEFLISRELDTSILDRWGIEVPGNVGSFYPRQRDYLHFHRDQIFEKH